MTREEAIEILQGAIKKPNTKDGYLGQAIDMAIKALSQEPCTDAVRVCEIYADVNDCENGAQELCGQCIHYKEPCDDAISREYLKKIAQSEGAYGYVSAYDIATAPPVTQKSGKWQVVSDGYGDSAYICECSECKDTVWVYKDAERRWNYCPNCGARMAERTDKK